MITVISMFRGRDAELLVQVVDGRLTDEQKQAWRQVHGCDLEDDAEDGNNMFFREFDKLQPAEPVADMFNADGETYPIKA